MRALHWRFIVCGWVLGLLAAGCTSSGKCRRGELGCACRQDGSCDVGGDCVRGTCARPSRSLPGDDDGGNAGAGGSSSGACSATTFGAACREYCVAFCRSQSSLCLSSRCAPGYCDPNGGSIVGPSCASSCNAQADPVACLNDLCADQIRLPCSEFRFVTDAGVVESGCLDNDPKCTLTAPAR